MIKKTCRHWKREQMQKQTRKDVWDAGEYGGNHDNYAVII